MSRSNYTEDYDERFPNALEFYRRNVENAIYGKRGQAFVRELIEALDAMPEKRLFAEYLEYGGEVCAIGSVGRKRGLDMSGMDSHDAVAVAKVFGIAECMVREITYENDETGGSYWVTDEAPEKRWQRMRDWAERHLKPETP